MFVECFRVGLGDSEGAVCEGGNSFVSWSLCNVVNGTRFGKDWFVGGVVK